MPGEPSGGKEAGTALRRTIYFLWEQGLDQAPLVVRKCLESWKEKNPSWEIVVLDRGNLESHVRLEVPAEKLARLEKNHLADLVRVYLLAGYGGVWGGRDRVLHAALGRVVARMHA